MRSAPWLGFTLCLASLSAFAQAPCGTDVDCPGEEICEQHRCVAPKKASETPAKSEASAQSEAGFRGGFEATVDFFPASSATVGFSSTSQMAVFTGGRLLLGYDFGSGLTLAGFGEFGYVAAGRQPGSGDDGLMLGLGPEVDWALSSAFSLFGRLNLGITLVQLTHSSSGTLADGAVYVAAGIRLIHVFDVHVLAGSDFAGGGSFGIGLSIGYF